MDDREHETETETELDPPIPYRVHGSAWPIPYRLTETAPHYEDHDQRAREAGL